MKTLLQELQLRGLGFNGHVITQEQQILDHNYLPNFFKLWLRHKCSNLAEFSFYNWVIIWPLGHSSTISLRKSYYKFLFGLILVDDDNNYHEWHQQHQRQWEQWEQEIETKEKKPKINIFILFYINQNRAPSVRMKIVACWMIQLTKTHFFNFHLFRVQWHPTILEL